jgi:protein SCO1
MEMMAALRSALYRLARSGSTLGSILLPALTMTAALAGEDGRSNAQHHRRIPDAAARTIADYAIPRIRLVRADGKRVWLGDELDDGRPVVLDFVYTTCTSICPLSSQTFSALQDRLGAERDRVHLVSISIDPEEDAPERLAEYSRHFNAGRQWQFYTGTLEASRTVQQAFGAYRGDKMSHAPLTLVRAAPGKSWVRFDGFATAGELLLELKDTLASR